MSGTSPAMFWAAWFRCAETTESNSADAHAAPAVWFSIASSHARNHSDSGAHRPLASQRKSDSFASDTSQPGNAPSNPFPERCSVLSSDRSTSSLGILPVSRLPER